MKSRNGIWVDSGFFKTIYSAGIDWIPQSDAIKTLRMLGAKLIEVADNGVLHWVDVYTDEHRQATPHFLTDFGWCYPMAHLRDGENPIDPPVYETEPNENTPIVRTERTPASLTDDDVACIREGLKRGIKGVELSIAFGISESLVSLIKHGHRYGNKKESQNVTT